MVIVSQPEAAKKTQCNTAQKRTRVGIIGLSLTAVWFGKVQCPKIHTSDIIEKSFGNLVYSGGEGGRVFWWDVSDWP